MANLSTGIPLLNKCIFEQQDIDHFGVVVSLISDLRF